VTRGDIYLAAMSGDYGKPRPVIIVQADIADDLVSRVVCPLTTFNEPSTYLWPAIAPTAENGLLLQSYVMIEKIGAVPPHRFRDQIGRAAQNDMSEIGRCIAILLGLA
jgi:mRNA interferase MazF